MSLREALSENLDAAVAESAIAEAPAPAEPPPSKEEVVAAAPEGDRPRGPDGKFLPKQEAAPVEVAPVKRNPPQSWKKDFHGHWEKLEPTLQDYIEQREREAAEGIGKHRGAYDRVRPIAETVQQYEPILRQHGLDPAKHVGDLLRAHQTLALAGPQEKLQMFAQLAQQYGVPLQALTGEGAQQIVQAPQPVFNPQVIDQKVQEAILGYETQQAIAAFEREAPTKYPHYERLKPTMAKLLSAEAADDLPDAYSKALRLDTELFTQEQERQRQASELERRQKADAAAKQAKAVATSPRSSSPSADMASRTGKKDLRSLLTDAVDQHAGRV